MKFASRTFKNRIEKKLMQSSNKTLISSPKMVLMFSLTYPKKRKGEPYKNIELNSNAVEDYFTKIKLIKEKSKDLLRKQQDFKKEKDKFISCIDNLIKLLKTFNQMHKMGIQPPETLTQNILLSTKHNLLISNLKGRLSSADQLSQSWKHALEKLAKDSHDLLPLDCLRGLNFSKMKNQNFLHYYMYVFRNFKDDILNNIDEKPGFEDTNSIDKLNKFKQFAEEKRKGTVRHSNSRDIRDIKNRIQCLDVQSGKEQNLFLLAIKYLGFEDLRPWQIFLSSAESTEEQLQSNLLIF